jgi:peptide/nickel transport system permease protein
MPNFWFGILLVLFFGVYLDVLPVFGYPDTTGLAALAALVRGNVSPIVNFTSHIILPAVALGTYMTAILTRVTRSNMLEQMGREYVKTARAKGISEYRVVTRHILRNALIPFITILGLEFAKLLGGAVVIETVFAWPGVGRLIIEAVSNRDYPIVQAGMLFVATFFVFINLGIDILYTYVDPRIEY